MLFISQFVHQQHTHTRTYTGLIHRYRLCFHCVCLSARQSVCQFNIVSQSCYIFYLSLYQPIGLFCLFFFELESVSASAASVSLLLPWRRHVICIVTSSYLGDGEIVRIRRAAQLTVIEVARHAFMRSNYHSSSVCDSVYAHYCKLSLS
jgi:hypothetical protein